MAISLASNKELALSGSGEVSWGIALSDIAAEIDKEVPDNAQITNVTLKFSGTAYNNNIFGALNEYAICGLTNSDSDAASNTSGGTGGTNLFNYGPFEIGGRKTVNIPEQSIDITKYFNENSPHSVQNTSYSRLSVAFTSKAIYNKKYTFSLSLEVTTHTHSYTSKVTTAATCTSAGVRTYTCSCGHSYTESIPALGHSWKTPTYTWSANGKTCTAKRVCSNNSSHTETATATITSAVKTAATCTAKGTTRYTAKFSVSWATTQTKDVQDIAILSHSYTSKVTAPTETSSGYTTHTCSHCGDSYKDTYIHRITAVANDDSYGTVTGGGDYTDGENIILTATPNTGYKFVEWSDGNTDNPRSVTVTGNTTYQAIYERITIPIKVNGKQVIGCYIVPSIKTIVFDVGTTPTVEAIPENSYPLKKLHINGNRTY